ncbi:response regulator [bacterium]|nr:response regulator [bacterium]
MVQSKFGDSINVLLVEDNPGDIRLTEEAFKEANLECNLNVVEDGVEALAFLNQKGQYKDAPKPDFILLDLNLPKKDGRQVLKEIKESSALKYIPVIILSTSKSEDDIIRTYNLHANCYISKPVDLDNFIEVVQNIKSFWFTIVALPKVKNSDNEQNL